MKEELSELKKKLEQCSDERDGVLKHNEQLLGLSKKQTEENETLKETTEKKTGKLYTSLIL